MTKTPLEYSPPCGGGIHWELLLPAASKAASFLGASGVLTYEKWSDLMPRVLLHLALKSTPFVVVVVVWLLFVYYLL